MAHCSLTLPIPHHQSAARLGAASVQRSPLRSEFLSGSSSCSIRRLNRLEQHALPQFAETLYRGLGANSQDKLVKFNSAVLQWAIELELPLPFGDATTWWACLVPIVLLYMFAPPGTAAGLVDFLYAPIHTQAFRSFSPNDVELGRQLGEGSFGVVYEGFITRGRKGAGMRPLHVVLKKVKSRVKGASEIHDSEIYMNHRIQRTASLACAEFLGTMQVKSSHSHGKLSEGMWLVWNFEGDRSLEYYLKQRNFPENVASLILGKDVKPSNKEEAFVRDVTVIRTIFKQILSNLQDLHRTGVVHRDVKPLNLILAQDAGEFKFIDFGACVDLRSGYNYVPDETVIDPTYAAPERYIMPTSTPQLPPDPLCSIISPLIWHLNTPDRFDLFSAGLILMQLCVKPLRHSTGLQSFNSELKRAGYDLNVWRSICRYSKEEFAYLDADDRAGWELATALLQPRYDKDVFIWPSLGNSRPTASAALRHRFFKGSFVLPKPVLDDQQDPLFSGESALQASTPYGKLSGAVYSVISTGYENLFKHTMQQEKGKKATAITSSSTIQDSPSFKTVKKVTSGGSSSTLQGSPSSKTVSIVGSSPPKQSLPSSKTVKNKERTALLKARGSVVGPEVEEMKGRSVTSAIESILQSLLSTTAVTKKISNLGLSVFNTGHENFVGQDEDYVSSTTPPVSNIERSLETLQKAGSNRNASRSFNWIGAVLPTIAAGAFVVASGWLILAGLSSSAHVSYDFGKLLASSSGISGSAFLAFFLVIKPWLKDHEKMHGKSKVSKVHAANEVQVTNENLEKAQMVKYKSVHSEQVKTGFVEAVQTLETQMSSLEALMLEKQQLSLQQQELVQKMESLLLQPSQGNMVDASEG